MANSFINLADLMVQENAKGREQIIEAVGVYPEISAIPVVPIEGLTYYLDVVTGLPTAGTSFRAMNEGVEATKGVRENRLVETFILDRFWAVDKRTPAWERAMAREAAVQMRALARDIARQVWYGTTADATGFQGVIDSLDSSMVVDATGTGSDTSSAIAIRAGENDVAFAGANNAAGWDMSDVYESDLAEALLVSGGSSSKIVRVLKQDLGGRLGLQIAHKYAIGRVKNIDSGKPLTDDLLDELISKFPAGMPPTHVFMTRRSALYLKQSRTATTPTGASAPWADFLDAPNGAKIKLMVTDAIDDTETAA